MVAGRDEVGRFIKGHPGIKPNKKNIRKEQVRDTKEETLRCAHSLLRPWQTVKDDLANPKSTRLEYLTAQAVTKGNTKFIQWLLEMAIGKPRQETDVTSKIEQTSVIRRTDGTVVEYSLHEVESDNEKEAG